MLDNLKRPDSQASSEGQSNTKHELVRILVFIFAT